MKIRRTEKREKKLTELKEEELSNEEENATKRDKMHHDHIM